MNDAPNMTHGDSPTIAASTRELLFQIDNTFHTRVNFLLVAESVFFAAMSQVWSTGGFAINAVLIALGACLTTILWYPLNVLQKRSSSVAGDLKAIDPIYEKYLNAIPHKLIATRLLAHGLPGLFLLAWVVVFLVLLARYK